jgi:hypothetical protein
MMKKTFAVVFALCALNQIASFASDILEVDYKNLIGRADLNYKQPADRIEGGIPVGNGRMGSLLWTVPSALKMQINRVDVFGNNNTTNSFFERHFDYCGGCGFVDVDFAVSAQEVFPNNGTTSNLNCYEGLATVNGRGVKIQSLAWVNQDIMALRIEDRREKPDAIAINLRMLRPADERMRSQIASSKLESAKNRIILTQQFTEDSFYCGTALVVGVIGRDAVVRQTNDQELRLIAPAGKGAFTVLIASAASFDRTVKIVAGAEKQLDAAEKKGFDGLAADNQAWWKDFWAKSFVHLHSADGVADMIEQNYNYYLYLMEIGRAHV